MDPRAYVLALINDCTVIICNFELMHNPYVDDMKLLQYIYFMGLLSNYAPLNIIDNISCFNILFSHVTTLMCALLMHAHAHAY